LVSPLLPVDSSYGSKLTKLSGFVPHILPYIVGVIILLSLLYLGLVELLSGFVYTDMLLSLSPRYPAATPYASNFPFLAFVIPAVFVKPPPNLAVNDSGLSFILVIRSR
jgi:hypothetical protein